MKTKKTTMKPMKRTMTMLNTMAINGSHSHGLNIVVYEAIIYMQSHRVSWCPSVISTLFDVRSCSEIREHIASCLAHFFCAAHISNRNSQATTPMRCGRLKSLLSYSVTPSEFLASCLITWKSYPEMRP